MRRVFIVLLWLLLATHCWSQQEFESCEDTLVLVTDLEVLCVNDYSTCNYGDWANVTVHFSVLESNATDNGDDIYMKLAVYSPEYNEVLYETKSIILCSHFNEDSGGCVNEGSYHFATEFKLAALDGDEVDFVPWVQISFSADSNGGTDLGGVNTSGCDETSTWNNSMTLGEGKELAIQLTIIVLVVVFSACACAYLWFRVAVAAQCCDPMEVEEEDDKDYNLMNHGSLLSHPKHPPSNIA